MAAAIASGDPAGIAAAYDRYAAALYGYCHWMLRQPADSADALRDAFVVAATKPGNLPEPAKLRPWLYAMARNQCQHRLRTSLTVGDSPPGADSADQADQAGSADGLVAVSGAPGQADDLPELVRGILAKLKPREREVIELNLRHDLNDGDLAIVLGVSRSRAHAMAKRARGRLGANPRCPAGSAEQEACLPGVGRVAGRLERTTDRPGARPDRWAYRAVPCLRRLQARRAAPGSSVRFAPHGRSSPGAAGTGAEALFLAC